MPKNVEDVANFQEVISFTSLGLNSVKGKGKSQLAQAKASARQGESSIPFCGFEDSVVARAGIRRW